MMGKRHRTWAWLGLLLAASLAVPGSGAAAMSGSRHCDEVAAEAPPAVPHQMPPGPTCRPPGPCPGCGALPCTTAMTCVAVSMLTPLARGTLPAPVPATACGALGFVADLLVRNTIPPTPPPIPLL